jgi:hypothetical protein
MLTFSATGTTDSSGSITFTIPLADAVDFSATGTTVSSGSVVFSYAVRVISFSGSSISSGSVVFAIPYRLISFSGTTVSSGSFKVQTLFIFIIPQEVVAHMSASIRESTPNTPDQGSVLVTVSGAPGDASYALIGVDHGITSGQGASVKKALLHLTLAADLVGTQSFTASPLNEPIGNDSTWNDMPATRAESASVEVSGLSKGSVVVIDITQMVAESVSLEDASGAQWYGVLVSGGEGTFYAATSTGFEPWIKKEVSRPPVAPFNLRPAGGLSVSGLPVVEADFHDPDGSDVLSGVHVQVSADTGFDAPLYDSGMVAAASPRIDLNVAALSGASGTLYYQAAFRDSRGVISPWSPVESFTLAPKGSLVVEPIVPSVLPKTVASLTGATMQSFYLSWERLQGGVWLTHWELPWHLASSVDVSLPDAYVLQEGVTYRRVLRVMDTTARADLAEDRAFYEDVEQFTVPVAVMA